MKTLMELGCLHGKMDENTLDSGKTIRCMEKPDLQVQKVELKEESGRWARGLTGMMKVIISSGSYNMNKCSLNINKH